MPSKGILVNLFHPESIKVLEIELNQDGEDLLFIVMKRIKTGELTGFCYNFSVSQKFQPTFITKPKMGISSSESSMLKRLFQKTYFELDKNAIHYEDFYLREESMERNMGLMIPTDQLIKVEHYIQKYSAKHDGDFHPRGFSMPNRYQLQGKRFLVYKGTPMIILVFYKLFQIFTSVESKIMRIDCLRQDTRQFIHSKVFHCEGEQIGILSQGKRLFDGFKLRGAIGSSLEIVFASTDMEEIDSDIDAKKYEIICSIQRHFKSIKLKESFECCIEGDDSVYQIEIYYLKATEKILIKISENTKEDSIRAPTDKLYSITKPKISNQGPELKIIQMLVLNFSEIYHPDDELTDEQVEKLVNVIIFEKLNKSERFFVDQITPQDMARVMKAEIGAKLANKQEWIEEMVSSDKFPNERTAFSELNRELRSDHEDRTHEFSRAADSPRGDDDNDVASTLMPNLRWEFDFNYNSHQQLHDEENEAISSGGSMSREGGFMQKDLFSTTRNLLKTIQPTKIEEFPVLSKHKTMKHKLLALYKFNSIRKQGVRKTSPIISPNRTQDLDIEVGNKEDEANKDRISHQNKRRLTRHGLTLDLIVTNHEDELDQNQKHTHTSNTKQKTIISQAAAASIKSKNVDQTSGAMYRSEYRIRDSPQISKRSGKYRRSMIQAHKSRVEKSHLDPERVETESKSSRKTSRIHVIKKLNSAVSNASGPDPTEDLKTAKMIDVNTFASPGLDSIPKFFRNTQIIEEDHPEDNFNKKSLFKLHTVKKESSQSIVEHNSASQPRSRLPSISLNESDFKVPVLEAPISKRPNTRNSSKKMTVLRMLPNEQMPSSNSFRRDSIDMPKHSSTLRSSKRALD